MDAFLATSVVVDHNHPAVSVFSSTVRRSTEVETVKSAYEAVRDRFPHSYDINAQEVSVSASDVLRHGHGICFAKAHRLGRGNASSCPIPAVRGVRRDRPSWVEARHSRFARNVMPRLESSHSRPEAATPLAGRRAEEYPHS